MPLYFTTTNLGCQLPRSVITDAPGGCCFAIVSVVGGFADAAASAATDHGCDCFLAG
jgi:hypothetical protein